MKQKMRAKFRLNSYTTELHYAYPHQKDGQTDRSRPVQVEKRTLNMTPVYPQGDNPAPEDVQFWEASPSGSIQLGVVNQGAWEHFKLGHSYYVDFTEAE